MENHILGGRDILLAQWEFRRRSNLLGGQTAKQMFLGGQPFPWPNGWRNLLGGGPPAAKDHFLGNFGIFFGNF